ncbi:ABC transporter ATP-binding protein [soil metagenome]
MAKAVGAKAVGAKTAGAETSAAGAATNLSAASLNGVRVQYPSGPALGPFDLTVGSGEIVAVVGASGAGKSTLLRLLAGIEPASSGEATRSRHGPFDVGFVFQSPTLMSWSDALANVALPLDLQALPTPEIRRRAQAALSAVGLGTRATARSHQLSGGMAMRVSLARALVTDPALLLLDEPFAALDSVTRRGLIEDLHRLWTARQAEPPQSGAPLSIVFVTHDVEEAVYLAARVVVLAPGGRTVADILSPGSLPRPERWRLDPAYRQTVEAVADALAASMAASMAPPP